MKEMAKVAGATTAIRINGNTLILFMIFNSPTSGRVARISRK